MTAYANAASTTPSPTALLRTLVLCDLADSTALTERLGDRDAADLFRRHDRLVRDLLPPYAGREIDKTDGFLLVFERPVQAVAFALAYQRQLAELAAQRKLPLTARVGIHFGDVVVWENERGDVERGAKPTEVEGLVKPVTARLAQLALPGQILLSGTAYDIAHRAQGELGAQLGSVRWRAHGRYRFKGVPDPVPVFEVGEEGIAPLKPPPWSSKAHREVPVWRRPAMLATELGLLALAITIPAVYLFKPAPAIAFANRDWVVVGDLKNLTGESKFDESLQTAFRIGLEQSRYVNVMSDLKARETLKLMQRDPDKTSIDRAVGAEIALRDSARALILPTVAEIGGRVRVTAEVIDPKSQATVYSESADGVGEDSVLPSLDKVNQQLRVRLGEALASVSSETKPLDKATTKNLDALRAYSLARLEYVKGGYKEALPLLQQAVTLDPDFALARALAASAYLNMKENVLAREQIDRAMQSRDRLTNRDRLYVEARDATFGAPIPALAKWKALMQLYPDFPTARGTYGFYSWQLANRYDEAIRAYSEFDSKTMPSAAEHDAILGVFELGGEKYDRARQLLDNGARLGLNFSGYRAATAAAQRKFSEAERLFASGQQEDSSKEDVARAITSVSIAADQARWSEAWKILAKAKSSIPEKEIAHRKLDAVEASLRSTMLSGESIDSLSALIQKEASGIKEDSPLERSDTDFRLLFAAYLSARQDDLNLARKALSLVGQDADDTGYPILDNMRALAKAEIARSEGHPEEAVKILKALPIDGSELCATHVALLDAYAAAGDTAAAINEARWLAIHRGRAYSEYNSDRVATPFNVVQSDLAILREAELLRKSGKVDQSKARLNDFESVWPLAREQEFLKRRMEDLKS